MSKDIEVFDIELLKQSNPNLVRTKEVPDYRKIRSALNLGYDVPGVRKVESSAAGESSPSGEAAGSGATGYVEPTPTPVQEAQVAPAEGTLVDGGYQQ